MVHCPVNHRSVLGGGRAPWQKRRAFTVVCLHSNKWDLSGFCTTGQFCLKGEKEMGLSQKCNQATIVSEASLCAS